MTSIIELKSLYPFTSHWTEIQGLKYHYLDEGEGDPIVMVHGNPTWSFYYRELIKALRGRYRSIVPDHIGCGLSDKPEVTDYDYRLHSRIDDLDNLIGTLLSDEKITLILHDWGGMIGMAYALRHPEKIGRLVVMNTAAFLPSPAKRIPLRLSVIRRSGPLAVLAKAAEKIDEGNLDVKQQEQNGEQVVAHLELHPGIADRLNPALIGAVFFLVGFVRPQHPPPDNGHHREHGRNDKEKRYEGPLAHV